MSKSKPKQTMNELTIIPIKAKLSFKREYY